MPSSAFFFFFLEIEKATQEILTKVPKPTIHELDEIVSRAQDAYLSWKDTSVLSRQQIMIRWLTSK